MDKKDIKSLEIEEKFRIFVGKYSGYAIFERNLRFVGKCRHFRKGVWAFGGMGVW